MSKQKSERVIPVADLEKAFTQAFPDGRGLRALQLARRTGVVTVAQLQRALALSRGQVERLLAQFERLAPEGLLRRLDVSVARQGQRGQPPTIYALGDLGAALLRYHTDSDDEPCGLTDPHAITHARDTLDVALAAEAAGLVCQTERPTPYAEKRHLRPDNLVTLPHGPRLVVETEQAADITNFRRLVKSLQHKVAFFTSPEAAGVSPTVRMLINLPRGPQWDATCAMWERAQDAVGQEIGRPLPFRLIVQPLAEFLAHPDWGDPPDMTTWELLGATPSSPPTRKALAGPAAKSATPALPPAALTRRSTGEDLLVIRSYWDYFQTHAADLAAAEFPDADPVFFTLMGVIYAASHDRPSPWQRAQTPRASLYLLRKYLDLHPRLREQVSRQLSRNASSMRWSVPTILHRMQTVIDTFLRYHGLHAGWALDAHPVTPDFAGAGPARFGVVVHLEPEILLGDADGVIPDAAAAWRAETALAWVLEALFVYGPELGLKTAGFW